MPKTISLEQIKMIWKYFKSRRRTVGEHIFNEFWGTQSNFNKTHNITDSNDLSVMSV